jgi:GntR family transcriptional regulator
MGDLNVSTIQADEAEASELGVEPGASLVQVARVIQAEHRPVAYLVDILLDGLLTPDELQAGFTGSVLDLLLKHESLALANSRTEIRAVAAPADIARALQIQRGDVLLQLIAYLYTTAGRVIDYSYSYFLPGYFRFHVVRSIGAFSLPAYRAVEAEPKSIGEKSPTTSSS